MTWKEEIRKNKPLFNMDEDNYIDILMDLQKEMTETITKTENNIIKFFDDMLEDSRKSGAGALPLGKTINATTNGFDNLINTLATGVKGIMQEINNAVGESFDMHSPSSEGEEQAERDSERMADSQREMNAERYYDDRY